MAQNQPDITRRDLQDLLEDSLNPDRKDAIVEAIEKNPRLRDELEDWRKMREDLHAIYDKILDEPFSPSLRHKVKQLDRAIRRS